MNIGKGMVAYQGHSFSDGYEAGYEARDKEAEEEKRELIDALISIVKLYTLPDKTKEIDIAIEAIEKAAGKPIDEVIK